jgi:hypothetical protein
LILLLLAGGLMGFGQTDTLKPGLTDEEVINLRSELVEKIKDNDLTAIKEIQNTLMANGPLIGEYLSNYEFFMLLYLTRAYDTILVIRNQGFNFTYKIGYPLIEDELRLELRKRMGTIMYDINEKYDLNNSLKLNEFLLNLLNPENISNNNPMFLNDTKDYLLLDAETEVSYFKQNTGQDSRMSYYPGVSHRKSVPVDYWEGQVGFGSYYKYGIFIGEIADVFSNYTTIKPIFIYGLMQNVYVDAGFSFAGALGKINQAKFMGQTVHGEYYGKYWEFYSSIGYRAINYRAISLIPVASLSVLRYKLYAAKTKAMYTMAYEYNEVDKKRNGIAGMGPGVLIDFSLWKAQNDALKLSVQFRYDALIIVSESQFKTKGLIHQFSTGLLFSLGPNETKK